MIVPMGVLAFDLNEKVSFGLGLKTALHDVDFAKSNVDVVNLDKDILKSGDCRMCKTLTVFNSAGFGNNVSNTTAKVTNSADIKKSQMYRQRAEV